jgi:putative ABC transport system permease protein
LSVQAFSARPPLLTFVVRTPVKVWTAITTPLRENDIMRTIFQRIPHLLVTVSIFLLAACGHDQEKAAEKNEPITVVISEKAKSFSQMPPSFTEFLDPKSPKCILKKEDIVPDGFMSWFFYVGTVNAKETTSEFLIYFYAMNPNHIRPMMPDLQNLDAQLVEQLAKQPNAVLVGKDRLERLNRRVGDRIAVYGINYREIDLEFEIVGTLPARYGLSAIMNDAYLKRAFDNYAKRKPNAHPMANKSLNSIWLRVRDKPAFERVKEKIENAPQFDTVPLKCENAAAAEKNAEEALKKIIEIK